MIISLKPISSVTSNRDAVFYALSSSHNAGEERLWTITGTVMRNTNIFTAVGSLLDKDLNRVKTFWLVYGGIFHMMERLADDLGIAGDLKKVVLEIESAGHGEQ